jgi:uridine kinase
LIDRVIINICGPSGSGKSLLAKELSKAIGKDISIRIPTDYFLKSSVYKNYDEFMTTPFQYDWKLLESMISVPLGREIQLPDYDFTKFKRKTDTEGMKLQVRRYIILDSMLPYPKADYLFLVSASKEERQKRLKERDQQWRTSVITNWKKLELTAEMIKKSKKAIHLQLNGSDEKEMNIGFIIDFLRARKMLD